VKELEVDFDCWEFEMELEVTRLWGGEWKWKGGNKVWWSEGYFVPRSRFNDEILKLMIGLRLGELRSRLDVRMSTNRLRGSCLNGNDHGRMVEAYRMSSSIC